MSIQRLESWDSFGCRGTVNKVGRSGELKLKKLAKNLKVDPNLHQKQGVNHLNRVLGYAPMVAEDGHATVFLTHEDWSVVADTLFHMDTPREFLPAAVENFSLVRDDSAIRLQTADCTIDVEIM